jgi:type I restriction enzyme R subunit
MRFGDAEIGDQRGKGFIRKPPKRVDYLLRYTRDFPLAVVEAKAAYKAAAD